MTADTDSDELCFTPAVELAAAFRRRTLSPVEVVGSILDRIDRVNPRINAFVTICRETALEQARLAEKAFGRQDAAELPPMFGLPVTVKDLEDTAGIRTTYGSCYYADHVPETDAPIWAGLKRNGAILLGKTTTPDFGSNTVTESRLMGITNNPWDVARTTGGSSGGAGAAVAAGLGPLATGTDGGGSIRVPSALCGIVGLKATPGRIPFNNRHSSYESVAVTGPMTRTVADCALMLDAIAGPDPYDAVSLLDPFGGALRALDDASIRGLKVAVCPDLGSGPIEAEVSRIFDLAARRFSRDLGAVVDLVTLDLPDVYDYFIGWWVPRMILFQRDTLLPLGRPEWLPRTVPWVTEKFEGLDLLSYVERQFDTRTAIHTAFADVFANNDLLIWPTTPCAAYPHPADGMGLSFIDGIPTREPVLENQRFTEAIAHAGYPAISIPAGFTRDGLPVGLQIAAGHGQETLLLRAAAAFEAVAPWAQYRPPC